MLSIQAISAFDCHRQCYYQLLNRSAAAVVLGCVAGCDVGCVVAVVAAVAAEIDPVNRAPTAARHHVAATLRATCPCDWERQALNAATRTGRGSSDCHAAGACDSSGRSVSLHCSDRCAKNFLCPAHLGTVPPEKKKHSKLLADGKIEI